eukprot:c15818_g1_i2 orf=605-1330(-)
MYVWLGSQMTEDVIKLALSCLHISNSLLMVYTMAASVAAASFALWPTQASSVLKNASGHGVFSFHPKRLAHCASRDLAARCVVGATSENACSGEPALQPSRREVALGGLAVSFGFGANNCWADDANIADKECEITYSSSGLGFCDKEIGVGKEAKRGMYLKANYVGKLEDGTVFDTSYKRGKPLIFRIGLGEVIKGWDEGILGGEGIPPMLPGGKRTLRIPPPLAYGERGAGCRGGCLGWS